MLDASLYPVLVSLCGLNVMVGFLYFFKFSSSVYMIMGVVSMFVVMMLWFKDLIRESTLMGKHSFLVQKALKMGMVWFIVSEVFFFFGFFWTFFHMSLSSSLEIGLVWPPIGIAALNPFQVPLLNTAVLLSSGFTVTWSHHSVLAGNSGLVSLMATVVLGLYFTFLQGWEYYQAPFSIMDSVYGSVFFLMTGFHGLHVLVGTIFLLIMLFRMFLNHFSAVHHVGFELAIWYWHFVDVVWLFLYTFVYFWFY